MKQLFTLCFFLNLLFSGKLMAQQKQGAFWYFGNQAGVNFNTEPPMPDFSGKSAEGVGAASISDAHGNLLFYSDGHNVFNRLHQIMPNGRTVKPSINAAGSTVMIVQKPGSPYLYYLFTAFSNLTANTPNFAYSLIDMRLDAGKGDIIANTKNSLIFSSPISYKFTAAMHVNDQDVWIITHSRAGNQFYSFLLSTAGISAPVTTAIGEMYTTQNYSGVMKSSPNNLLIGDVVPSAKFTQLLDFNRTTGIITNARKFTFPGPSRFPYGMAFSPDNSRLYLTDIMDIYQYKLQAGSFQDVLASRIILSRNGIWYHDIQLAMNGKLYVIAADTARRSNWNEHLSIIHCPNKLGQACNFQDTVLHVARSGGINLPALNQTLFRNANNLQLTAAQPYICPGGSVTLSAFGAGADTFTWLPAPGLTQASGSQVTVNPTVTTPYTVTGYSQCSSATATVTVPVFPPAFVNAGPDKVICTSGSVKLGSTEQPGLSYAWNASPYLSDTTVADPVFTFPTDATADQIFELVVHLDGPGSACGNRSDTVLVTVKAPVQDDNGTVFDVCSKVLRFPNIITPNNDNLNETFTASALHFYPNNSLSVFNRWGREVYKSQNYQGNWNGVNLAAGTYFYLFRTNQGESFKGWVEIVR